MSSVAAADVVTGDIVRLDVGWRNVLDVWARNGFVLVVASDTTGLFAEDESVEIGRRRRATSLRGLR